MIVLGFDTATQSTAVALRLVDGRTVQARDDPAPGAHPGHATRLLAMAHALLGSAGVGWGELDRIAVGVGPGTFTGLRVGIASARALAQSLDAELVGVSSLRALAEGARADGAQQPSLLAVIDARRGEVFVAAYSANEPIELVQPRVLAPGDLESVLVDAEQAGADAEWSAVGDGAVRYREQLERLPVRIAPDSSPVHRVSAEAICELASRRGHAAGRIEDVLPDYRRRPDAEVALESVAASAAPEP